MAIIIYKTWTTEEHELEIFCHDDGISFEVEHYTGLHFNLDYGDVDKLIEFLQENRKDKE